MKTLLYVKLYSYKLLFKVQENFIRCDNHCEKLMFFTLEVVKFFKSYPYQRNVDGVWPWPRYKSILTSKVPLAVLHKEVEGQEEDGQGEEKEETVVEVAEADAVDVAKLPVEGDHLRVQSKGHA